ncbi:MAG: M23 family metallopeptidase, partial [Actinomycetota bacterium]|nr:M23 family metallopeptidase [Actinomycetota bacterium]
LAAADAARTRLAAATRQGAVRTAAAGTPSAPRAGRLLWPAQGPKTSDFGWRTHPLFGTRSFHAGIDIGAGHGAPIWAADAGVVVAAAARGGYGNTVVVDHGEGLSTLYAHQSRVAARPGQAVSRGQVIGYVGSSGYSTGPHLHFETREDGTPVDPMRYL